jgi:hypothetical protein
VPYILGWREYDFVSQLSVVKFGLLGTSTYRSNFSGGEAVVEAMGGNEAIPSTGVRFLNWIYSPSYSDS